MVIAETVDDMVVDHARGLHVRIDDGRTDEAKPAFHETLRDGLGEGVVTGISKRERQRFQIGTPSTKDHTYSDKLPPFLLNRQEGLRVTHRRADLETVTNDARIGQ